MLKKIDLASLKSGDDVLDIDKLQKVPIGLNSMKSKVDKLDVDKSHLVPVDLSKLSDVVKNDVVKKNRYDKLVTTISAIQTTDTCKLVLTTRHTLVKLKKSSDLEHSNKYITTQEINKFTAEILLQGKYKWVFRWS